MKHPYVGLPDRQFNRKDPGLNNPAAFDPVSDVPFRIDRMDRIVTAGSCFAQHVARFVTEAGFNHYITEAPHRLILPELAERHNYGLFAARYGNVYTARQLLQLLHRAYGIFTEAASPWDAPGGGVLDPFRPQIQPGGFADAEELAADRHQHFAAIREAIENMDVFVFTLGLTECWIDAKDGAVFPVAPGVAGGRYDPERVKFSNFDEQETAEDLLAAFQFIRDRNPDCRFIVTVSPVPLNATFEPRHVYVSTAWSKAVLRIAAEKVCAALPDCVYFPSFEIITSPQTRGRYFGPDCREVRPAGVNHVMRLFFRHFAGEEIGASRPTAPAAPTPSPSEAERQIQLLCDEEMLNNDAADS